MKKKHESSLAAPRLSPPLRALPQRSPWSSPSFLCGTPGSTHATPACGVFCARRSAPCGALARPPAPRLPSPAPARCSGAPPGHHQAATRHSTSSHTPPRLVDWFTRTAVQQACLRVICRCAHHPPAPPGAPTLTAPARKAHPPPPLVPRTPSCCLHCPTTPQHVR